VEPGIGAVEVRPHGSRWSTWDERWDDGVGSTVAMVMCHMQARASSIASSRVLGASSTTLVLRGSPRLVIKIMIC
jgi:hypothetical protein